MATASKSQSTKRSEAPNKIKIQMNGSSAKVIHGDCSDGASSDSSSSEEIPKGSKSVKRKESTDDPAKKAKEAPIRVDTSVLENVTCTACGRQLNPYKNNSVQKHPELKVIICKKCDKFLDSGQIAKDKDGVDEQCRWCGEGGRLVVCDNCSCAFCKACVMRNFNRSEFNNINNQDSWKCYICDKVQLQGLRDNYRNVREAMKALQAKKKRKEQAILAKDTANGNGRTSSGKASGVATSQISNRKSPAVAKIAGGGSGEDIALSMQDLEVDHMRVEVIMDKLSTATNTFKEMLRALRSQFNSTSPRKADEAPPMFNFSLGNSTNIDSKKLRCAKALNMGLQTYFQSLRKILHPQTSEVVGQMSKKVPDIARSSVFEENEDVLLVNDNSSDDELLTGAEVSSRSSEGRSVLKTHRSKEKNVASRAKGKSDSESLKGKLSVSSLFSKSPKSVSAQSKNSDTSKSFKDTVDQQEKESSEVESPTPSSKSPSECIVKDTHNDCESDHHIDEDKHVESETNSCNESNKIAEGSVGSEASADAEQGEEVNSESDDVDENVVAKLNMIQELADELSNSADDDEGEDASDEEHDEEIEDSSKDNISDNAESPKKRKGKSTSDSKKNIGSSPIVKRGKHGITESRDGQKKTKPKGVHVEKSKNVELSKSNIDDADDDDGSSSSDPLDSDEDDDDDDRKTRKKKKVTEKGTENKEDDNSDKVKKTKPTDKESAQSSKNNAKKTNGSAVQPKGKTDLKKKDVKSKTSGKEDEDEVDKEIEKLSRLPTVQKKKQQTKKDQVEEEEEEEEETNVEDAKKGTRQSKRTAKKQKDALDLGDLSSDGNDNKSESEEDIDSDLEPTVSFGPSEKDMSAEKDNLEARSQLLEGVEDDDEGEDDEEGEDSSNDDEDEDVSSEPKSKSKISNKEEGDDDEKEDANSDSDNNIGQKKRLRNQLLDSKLTDSDSDVGVSKKRKKKEEDSAEESIKEERQSSSGSSLDSDSDDKDESSNDDENDGDEEGTKKKGRRKGKKRRKRKNKKDGSNEEEEEEGEEEGKGKKSKKRKRIKKMSDSSDGDDDDDKGGFGKRKKIRKVMSNKKLEDTTKAAAKAEEKRRKRIAAKQREFNVETVTDENNPMNAPMTTKLILEPGKEEGDDPIVQVNKKLIRKLKPHQVEAVQFMWDCLYESVKRTKKEDGAGCILAHCMGLGKTLSVISFVHTVLTHCKSLNQRTCLVVCPLNTVLNWRNEWTMWFDKKDQLEVWELASCKQNVARAELLREWQESGGIMIIGYEMYRNLTMGARIKNKKQKKAFQETLVDPGPDLCVCDEGHILKNENSSLSKAMNTMKTRRRIVLTGTPLQNNLNEYHCMVNFVKPNLLGTRKEFNNRFISPIQNGQCTDSTQRDVRIMKARAHVLHEMLAGCVQRRDYSALTKFLPPKQEYVMSIRLSDVQIDLYQKYLELTGQGVDGVFNNKGARLFKDYQNLMKIWTHPWVLKLAEIRDESKMKYDDDEDSFIDDDSDEERSESSSSSDSEENIISDSGDEETAPKGPHGKKGTKRTRAKARRQAGEDSDPEEVIVEWKSKMRGDGKDSDVKPEPADSRVSSQWWAEFVTEDDKAKLELSNKLYLLFEILRMCEEIGDKVLIFSQSILSLNIIENFLETVDSKFQAEIDKKFEENPEAETEEFGKCWTKNLDYYRMDGSTSAHHRQMWAESFNSVDNYRARLFLISTKAGGLGINLVAANRVIIFDASWNPSHDVQSIFRVYRFGQIKPCYIYRFLAQGTMEEKIYERQVTKLSLSQRVVDEHQIERHFSANDLRELYNFKPEKWEEEGEHATLALPKDPLLAEILKTHRKCVVSFHEHDSLLENQVEQTLSEEEKKAAWEEYENEKKGIIVRGPGMESMKGVSWPMMAAAQILSKEQIAATVHALRQQLPDLPEEVFHMHVQQALRRQVQMKQDEMRRMEMMRMQELTYLNMMQQEMGGMSGMGAMQNMAPWMQIQQLRAMQNHLMRGNRNYGGMSSSQISNRPDEAINLDESPSK